MHATALQQILDLARWAPSGDNTQPWRFELLGEDHFVVHGHDTREHVVCDLDGHSSQLSIGALIETAAIAATAHGLALWCQRDLEAPEARPRFAVRFVPREGLARSPLIGAIPRRRAQRRPMPTTPLQPAQRQALERAVGPDYRLHWTDTGAGRAAMARLLFASAKIRLTIPEAFEARRSVGLNRCPAGTLVLRLQRDWLPARRCAAHVAILTKHPPGTIDDYVAGGRAMQRFWLTATSLGLNHQPEMTPVVFSRYAREGRRFSVESSAWDTAQALAPKLDALLDGQADRAVWLGRIGGGPPATTRFGRLSLAELICGDMART